MGAFVGGAPMRMAGEQTSRLKMIITKHRRHSITVRVWFCKCVKPYFRCRFAVTLRTFGCMCVCFFFGVHSCFVVDPFFEPWRVRSSHLFDLLLLNYIKLNGDSFGACNLLAVCERTTPLRVIVWEASRCSTVLFTPIHLTRTFHKDVGHFWTMAEWYSEFRGILAVSTVDNFRFVCRNGASKRQRDEFLWVAS